MPGRESENSVRSSLAIPDNPPGGKEKSEQGGRREGEEEGGCGGVGLGGGHTVHLSATKASKVRKGYPGAGCTVWLQLFGLNLILVQDTRVNFLQKKKQRKLYGSLQVLKEHPTVSHTYNLISWITR